MKSKFQKVFFFVLLGLSLIWVISAFTFDLHDLYTELTYHINVIPAVLVIGAPAFLCFLSLLITGVCVRKWGHAPMRFSWINSLLFLLLGALCAFIAWQCPRDITSIEYIKYCYSDLILLCISCVVAITLISAISYMIRLTRNQAAEEVEISKNWYSVFMLIMLVMSLLYLMIGILSFERGFEYRPTFFYLIFTLGTILFTSIVTALLSVCGSMLMEKNKPMAFMMSIFTAIVFLVPHAWCIYNIIDSVTYIPLGPERVREITYTNSYDDPNSLDYSVKAQREDVVIAGDAVEDASYYEDNNMEAAFHMEEYNPLWYNSESPGDSIESVIKGVKDNLYPSYILLHLDITGLTETDPDQWDDHYSYISDVNERMFLKACRFISEHRNSVGVESMIRMYRPLIQSIISQEHFYEQDFDEVIEWLNYAFKDINGSFDGSDMYSPTFEKIYYMMSDDLTEDSDRYSKYYDRIAEVAHINKEACKSFYFGDDVYKEAVVWAYSFWARRYMERTIPQARAVISAIEEMYMEEYHD